MTDPVLYSLAALPGRENEDAAASGDGIAVVVDGAGLPKSRRRGCGHSVSWYSRMLAESFRVALADRRTSMADALATAIAEVTAAHTGVCDLAEGSPSGTVAAWRIVGDDVEHLVLCDASIVLIPRSGEPVEITDDRLDAVVGERAARLLGADAASASLEERAAAHFQALDAARNVEGGFWCCHTDPLAACQARTGRTPLRDLAGIVAASDGGTRGFQSHGAHPLERFAALALAGDLAGIAAEIRAAEGGPDRDPLEKPHDDITLLAATFAAD